MQAGLVCLFIEQRWGFERLVALLKQFTRDTTTAQAVEATFKIEPEEFDKEFDAFLRQRYAQLLPRMAEWEQWYETASKAMQAEKWADVIEPARKAAELYPENVGPDSPAVMLAFALDKLGRRSEAIAALETYRKAGGWEPDSLRQLATWFDEAGQTDKSTEVLRALNYVDPMNTDQHVKLGERLLAAKQPADALREYEILIALKTHDQAQASFGAARALRELGDGEASRRRLLDALATAPFYKPAQDMLLQTIEERTKNE
jgi:tetratricopeptide (TPR) repeat protein